MATLRMNTEENKTLIGFEQENSPIADIVFYQIDWTTGRTTFVHVTDDSKGSPVCYRVTGKAW